MAKERKYLVTWWTRTASLIKAPDPQTAARRAVCNTSRPVGAWRDIKVYEATDMNGDNPISVTIEIPNNPATTADTNTQETATS